MARLRNVGCCLNPQEVHLFDFKDCIQTLPIDSNNYNRFPARRIIRCSGKPKPGKTAQLQQLNWRIPLRMSPAKQDAKF